MVKRIISLFTKRYSGLHEAAILLAIFSILSQLLGLVRDRLLVHYVGPGATLDVYYAAFKVPDLIFAFVGSLFAMTAVVPFLSEKMQHGGHGATQALLKGLTTVFIIGMSCVLIVAYIAMPWLAHGVAPGFSLEQYKELVGVSRIMLLSPFFFGLQYLFGSINQVSKKFFIFAASPVLYNAGILFGIIYFFPTFGVYGLAFGVLIGSVLFAGLQIVSAGSLGFPFQFSLSFQREEIFRVVKVALPRALTLGINTLVIFVMTALASTIENGSISIVTFALNIQTIPISFIGVSYAVAAFPTLAELWVKGDRDVGFFKVIQTSCQHILFWTLPLTAFFIVLRAQIVRVIYGASTLSWNDTKIIAALLAILSITITAQSLVFIFIRAYYAAGRTRKPFLLAMIGAFITIASTIIFLRIFENSPNFIQTIELFFRVSGGHGTEVLALGCGYVLGNIFSLIVFTVSLKNDFNAHFIRPLITTFAKSGSAALIGGYSAYLSLQFLGGPLELGTGTGILLQGLGAGLVGTITAIVFLWLVKSEELITFYRALKSKFWKATVVTDVSSHE